MCHLFHIFPSCIVKVKANVKILERDLWWVGARGGSIIRSCQIETNYNVGGSCGGGIADWIRSEVN